jgi:hypothetical protein
LEKGDRGGHGPKTGRSAIKKIGGKCESKIMMMIRRRKRRRRRQLKKQRGLV